MKTRDRANYAQAWAAWVGLLLTLPFGIVTALTGMDSNGKLSIVAEFCWCVISLVLAFWLADRLRSLSQKMGVLRFYLMVMGLWLAGLVLSIIPTLLFSVLLEWFVF
jgi:FtsH-binding integral membrane protein